MIAEKNSGLSPENQIRVLSCAAGLGFSQTAIFKRSKSMRVHQNQVNSNAQLDAMYAAQKAAAKRKAEQTRKKLFEFASELAGEVESEGCIVKLNGREEPLDANKQRMPQARNRKKSEDSGSETADNSISDWA
jgi:hypothetical protein